MNLPVRSVLVTVAGRDGNSATGMREVLISPGSKVERRQYLVDWNVTDIVAPNLFHHAGVPKAKAIYPKAELWAVPGLDTKRPDISWTRALTEENWPYGDVLTPVTLHGMPKVNEVVLVHKPSRSLILTDLCFNMHGQSGLGPKVILGLFGTFNRLGVSRVYTMLIKNRAEFEQSLRRLFALDFDNLIVSHGDNVIGNGKAVLSAALKERGFVV